MLDDELVELGELGLACVGAIVAGEVVGTVWVQVWPRVHVGRAVSGNIPLVVLNNMAALLLCQILLDGLQVLVVDGHGNDGGEEEGGALGNTGGMGDVGQDEQCLGRLLGDDRNVRRNSSTVFLLGLGRPLGMLEVAVIVHRGGEVAEQ